jgi:hypothetical protein
MSTPLGRTCKARQPLRHSGEPQDCDYPFCSCETTGFEVVDALRELGWMSPEDVAESKAEEANRK